MKKPVMILLTLMMILLSGCGAASQTATEAPKSTAYTQISSSKAMEMMEKEQNYIILDVRTQEEYKSGHIPNAICVPNETIGSADIPELPDKDQMILVYCRSGRRSKEAAQKLADMGYTNIVEFGGIIDWTGETVTE